MIEYITIVAAFYFYRIRVLFKKNFVVIGRIFEGIAVGLYANLIGDAFNGITTELICRTIIAIILTYIGVNLQRYKNKT